MKVLAVKGRGDTYLCEVSHTELERFMNLYYGNMDRLKEGSEIDLGKGYDFFHETVSALKKTQDFIEGNQKVISTIMSGIKIIGTTEKEQENG